MAPNIYDSTHANQNLTAGDPPQPHEKDFSNGSHLNGDMEEHQALNRIRTAGSISISPELFEKLYLSPQNKVSGDLRKTFGNPTPIALVGFLLSLTPLSCDLMGWRGAGGSGAAGTATYIYFGGMLMVLGAIGELTDQGAFWFGFAGTLMPFYNAWGAYSTDPTKPGEGLTTVGFNASFGASDGSDELNIPPS
ncbi:hypothetical protein LTR66_004467 [Elasticomyces elasticus]|nr:hypothetical protein LTR28_001991 [Elasticomyces elasticus]KAK4992793.1 hypothetical protein LTR50_000917 [Elasticomyces elasticus]KAK4995783.1 hypothetical protein LTR66_004467 [Elasticomyces elasticus]